MKTCNMTYIALHINDVMNHFVHHTLCIVYCVHAHVPKLSYVTTTVTSNDITKSHTYNIHAVIYILTHSIPDSCGKGLHMNTHKQTHHVQTHTLV